MVLPIYTFGQAVLKRAAKEDLLAVDEAQHIVANMWDTMYRAYGVGLAAPQVGLGKRVFVVDTEQLLRDEPEEDKPYAIRGIKTAFVNPTILEYRGDEWEYEEGCLSLPGIRALVSRPAEITIRYQDPTLEWREEEYDGIEARVIQHEYDHLLGTLFVEKVKPLKRSLLRRRLDAMRRGKVSADYPIRVATT